jgi:hypothetical protein
VGLPVASLGNLTFINERSLVFGSILFLQALIFTTERGMFTHGVKINIKHAVRVPLFITGSDVNWTKVWHIGQNYTNVLNTHRPELITQEKQEFLSLFVVVSVNGRNGSALFQVQDVAEGGH